MSGFSGEWVWGLRWVRGLTHLLHGDAADVPLHVDDRKDIQKAQSEEGLGDGERDRCGRCACASVCIGWIANHKPVKEA